VEFFQRRSRDNRLVGRTVARVSAEEHMANYRAARALLGKGRNAGEGAAGISKNSANKGAGKSAVKKGETKEVTLATAFSEK
jgi:hypothetical protein